MTANKFEVTLFPPRAPAVALMAMLPCRYLLLPTSAWKYIGDAIRLKLVRVDGNWVARLTANGKKVLAEANKA